MLPILLTGCANAYDAGADTSVTTNTVADTSAVAEKTAEAVLNTAVTQTSDTLSSASQTESEPHADCIEFAADEPADVFTMPYDFDFSDDIRMNYVYMPDRFDNYQKWYIGEIGENTSDYNGNHVDENIMVLKKWHEPEQIPAGSSVPSVHFGNSQLTDYSVSFDFLGEYLHMSIYSESLITDGVPDSTDMQYQPFWFGLSSTKGLAFNTMYGRGAYWYNNHIRFDSEVWNSAELKLNGNSLHLIFNGEDMGEIYEFEEKPQGSVAFDFGRSGGMIKNIRFSPDLSDN